MEKSDFDENLSLFHKLVQKSQQFEKEIYAFSTQNNRINFIAKDNSNKQAEIGRHARNTHPIMHHKILTLIDDFLIYKQQFGTEKEKILYGTKNKSLMNRPLWIKRAFEKRPLAFIFPYDNYLLRNGKSGADKADKKKFELIGTNKEKKPFVLADYLSYDEMAISALIGASVPTYFINNGDRENMAHIGEPGTYEEQGIYIALVGARFEKTNLMEPKYILITPEKNTQQNGYGINRIYEENNPLRIWSKLYGLNFPTFNEAASDMSGRYKPVPKAIYSDKLEWYFDTLVYKRRMELTILPFLFEAEACAKKYNKQAYVHVIGAGLGAWEHKGASQKELMLQVYADIIKQNKFHHISDINFSWFAKDDNEMKKFEEIFQEVSAIKIHFSKRKTADPLSGSDKGKLLIASYAWDSNAFPGNEYWMNALKASGDPAAACCSTIAELQNPYINENMLNQVQTYGSDHYYVSSKVSTKVSPIEKVQKKEIVALPATPIIQTSLPVTSEGMKIMEARERLRLLLLQEQQMKRGWGLGHYFDKLKSYISSYTPNWFTRQHLYTGIAGVGVLGGAYVYYKYYGAKK
jgi:hypothetical protein